MFKWKWLNSLRKSEQNESIIANEVFQRNIQYISVLSIFCIPINIFHIFLFYFNLNPQRDVEYLWRMGIILSHLILMIFFLMIAGFFFYFKRTGRPGKLFMQSLLYLVFVVAIVFAVSITTIDQLVTSAINPFLFVCIFIPMTILIRPVYSFSLFIIAYILFYFALGLTQTNTDVLLSNRVNGFSFVGVGLFLTLLMWNNAIRRYNQDRIIEKQREDLKNKNETLSVIAENLAIANATKDRFFSIIGHDLRGSFNGVLGFSELIELEYKEGSTKNLLEYIGFINSSARQAFLLLENLLLWANSQKGNLVYEPTEFSINNIILNIFSLLKLTAKTKKVSLILEANQDYIVFLDEKMIETIFRNLISNAIKFTNEDGEIKVSISKNENSIFISVKDNGIGMSPETIEKLFDVQTNISTKGTRGEKGSGLGLVLCKEFIEQNRGSIKVESVPNRGSNFIVSFPIQKS
jgi:signal transduction histidine kinase